MQEIADQGSDVLESVGQFKSIDLKTNFPVKTPPFREEPGWGGVFAAPSQPLSER
jgi:hypothetical protein